MKLIPAATLLFVIFCFSCKKSSTVTDTTTPISTAANIDSITGYYAGVTTGDSVYYYTDGSGNVQYAIRSFSSPDSLVVTSVDTASITVSSRFYSVTFPYVYYYTGADSVTILQYQSIAESGYVSTSAILVDTANNVNHINLNISTGQNKRLTSTFALYKR